MSVAARSTRQRKAVAALLADTDEFRSAQELHRRLADAGEGVGLTTVYRTLQAMADAGEIDVMRPPGGEHVYRRCGQADGHHHHLVCRSCGHTVEIADSAAATRWVASVAAEHGFGDVSHSFDLFGLCQRCSGGG